jgi:hypothetical protein
VVLPRQGGGGHRFENGGHIGLCESHTETCARYFLLVMLYFRETEHFKPVAAEHGKRAGTEMCMNPHLDG